MTKFGWHFFHHGWYDKSSDQPAREVARYVDDFENMCTFVGTVRVPSSWTVSVPDFGVLRLPGL